MNHEQLRQGLKEKLSRVNKRMNESEAGEEAKRMGLFSKGFGRWSDTEGGATTHVSKGGKLVPFTGKDGASGGAKAPAAKAAPKAAAPKKQKFDADTADIGAKVPDVTKAGMKKAGGQDGTYTVSHKDAKTNLAGMIKKLTQENPNSRISIEPSETGFTLKAIPVEQGQPKKTTVDVGALSISPIDGSISVNGQPLKVSPTESKLLTYLAGNQDKVIARGQLLQQVWGAAPDIATRTVDMTIARLKQKMGEAGAMLQNVRGMGYRISSGTTPAPSFVPDAPSNDGYEETEFDKQKRIKRDQDFMKNPTAQRMMVRRLRQQGMSDDEIRQHPVFQRIAAKDAEHDAKYAAGDAERERQRKMYQGSGEDEDWQARNQRLAVQKAGEEEDEERGNADYGNEDNPNERDYDEDGYR